MSYCCMPNVQSIISRHKKNLLRPTEKSSSNEDTCNCRVKNSRPLQGNCLASAVVYKASLDTKNGQKVYFGSCATPSRPDIIIINRLLKTCAKEMQQNCPKLYEEKKTWATPPK